MKTSQEGRELIEHFEGRYTRVYRDPIGILTGGIGHIIPKGTEYYEEGKEIPDEVIERWFDEDLEKAERAANKVTDPAWELAQQRFDAIASFCFNLGSVKIASKLWRRLVNGPLDYVPAALMAYVNAGGHPLEGLRRRREAEGRLFQGLDWREPSPSPVRTLRRGSVGPDVFALTRSLTALRLMNGPSSRFGPVTQEAVETLQKNSGLVVDGVFGPKSAAAPSGRWAGRALPMADMSGYCIDRNCSNYALTDLGLVVCSAHATREAWVQVACDAMRELQHLHIRVAALELAMDKAETEKGGQL